jgi:hypothetical protein
LICKSNFSAIVELNTTALLTMDNSIHQNKGNQYIPRTQETTPTLEFHSHYNRKLRWDVIARFVDIGGIGEHQFFNFLFIKIEITSRKMYEIDQFKNSRFGDFVDRIYAIELEINRGYHRYRQVCFITWHNPRN